MSRNSARTPTARISAAPYFNVGNGDTVLTDSSSSGRQDLSGNFSGSFSGNSPGTTILDSSTNYVQTASPGLEQITTSVTSGGATGSHDLPPPHARVTNDHHIQGGPGNRRHTFGAENSSGEFSLQNPIYQNRFHGIPVPIPGSQGFQHTATSSATRGEEPQPQPPAPHSTPPQTQDGGWTTGGLQYGGYLDDNPNPVFTGGDDAILATQGPAVELLVAPPLPPPGLSPPDSSQLIQYNTQMEVDSGDVFNQMVQNDVTVNNVQYNVLIQQGWDQEAAMAIMQGMNGLFQANMLTNQQLHAAHMANASAAATNAAMHAEATNTIQHVVGYAEAAYSEQQQQLQDLQAIANEQRAQGERLRVENLER